MEVDSAPATLHFSVSDTGIGIPSDQILSAIFEKLLHKPMHPPRANTAATGLGLAISKRLVELMGGEFGLRAPRSGTRSFRAVFSIAEDPAPAPIESAPVALGPRALRVLLADDSEENRFLIRGYLKNSRCIIDEVENGAQAVEQFKQRAYDLVTHGR